MSRLVTPHIGTLDFARNPTARASRKPWLEHWLETCRDLSELRATHPMMDAVIDEIDGRMIRIGDHWLADFASCNYLGFDLDREIIDAIPGYIESWGTHPSWSRLLGSPVLYEEIEDAADRAARLRGLARPADDHPHPHVGDPAARGLGDDLPRRPRAQDDLRRLPGRPLPRRRGPPLPLRGPGPSGRAPPRRGRSHPARVHGRRQQHDRQRPGPAGVRRGGAPSRGAAVRRRRPRVRRHRRALPRTSRRPTASRGNSVVRHAGESYDGLVLVGGFSKAYSSLLAFIACPTEVKQLLKVAAPPYLYSGPVAGRLARHRARRVRRQRAPRRRAAHRPARAHRAPARRPRPARRRDAEPLGPADRRDPAPPLRAHRRRRSASSSSAASTSRSPPTRSFPRTRSASASS